MFSLSLFRSSLLLLPTDVSDCGSRGAREVKGYGPLRGPQEILREWDVVGVGVGRWVGLRRLRWSVGPRNTLLSRGITVAAPQVLGVVPKSHPQPTGARLFTEAQVLTVQAHGGRGAGHRRGTQGRPRGRVLPWRQVTRARY